MKEPMKLLPAVQSVRSGEPVWLPDMDLNHDKQIQSLLCYRYTIGQTSDNKVGSRPEESRIVGLKESRSGASSFEPLNIEPRNTRNTRKSASKASFRVFRVFRGSFGFMERGKSIFDVAKTQALDAFKF
jgi:hypothetical protein